MKSCLRNIIAFLLIYSVCSDGYSQTNTQINPNGHNTFYYTNGKVSSEGMMKDGKPDGYWKAYSVTGILKSEGNRKNGLLDSTWIFYTETADTLEIINYVLHKKSGYNYNYETITEKNNISRHYLKSKELYLDDKKEGQSLYFYPSGKIKQIINYKNGKRQGISKEFDEEGTVITMYEYHNDYMISRDFINRVNDKKQKTGVWRSFYDDGKIKEEDIYKNGERDGTTKFYSEKGNLINERVYQKGKIIEEGIQMKVEPIDLFTYYEDGVTIKRNGLYLDSIPVGYHYFYNKSGVPEKAIRYENGIRTAEGLVDENKKRTGEWRIYLGTGELRAQGRYANDLQNGQWEYYFKTGGKVQIGNFTNGYMDGDWKWYFPSGNLLREEIYVRGRLNGVSIQYSDSATIVAKGEYIEGEREGAWIENVGDALEEGSYIMGLKNGVWKTYYKDGKLNHSGNFVQGHPDGRHVFYYPDGTLKEEQYYVMGRRDKNWKKYYENGSLFLTITYKNDDEIRINGIRIEDVRKR